MKKLLILVEKIGAKKEFFAEHIAKSLPSGMQVVIARFSDLMLEVNGKDIKVKILDTEKELKDFDLVYFRRATGSGGKFFSMAGTVGVCLAGWGIRFMDTTFKNIGPAGDKFTSLVRLSLAGLPTIPTVFCWRDKVEGMWEEIVSQVGLPLVAKQLSCQRGNGVFLVNSKEELLEAMSRFPEGEFMFQKFCKSDEEYRILVFDKTIGAFERKIRTDPKEFRCNVALGAREEFIEIKKMPQDMKETAIAAAKALEIEVAGVDILVDKKGKQWLLEVNRGPGLTYDPKISPELDNIASFFREELRQSNEK